MELPDQIGKFKVTGSLGQGAMGKVYKGYDEYVDRTVAIKVLTDSSTQGDDPEAAEFARKLFINEVRSVGLLDHPNILKVYEAGEVEGQPYMAIEYVDGGKTLETYCKPGNLLPMETAIELMRQCADALDYAHRHHVNHRDIKPANIMITDDMQVKIVDFGIAQRTSAEQTQILGWFCSPLYMSPEQAKDEEVTSQSDLFSLGAVMYEFFSGIRAFGAKGITGVMHKVIDVDPAPLTSVRSEAPEQLTRIVARALAKDHSDRYQSGAEIVADLDALTGAKKRSPQLVITEEKKPEIIQGLKFFKGFSDLDIKSVLDVAVWESFAEENIIIEEDDSDSAVYILVSGMIEVLIGEVRICTLGKGECFGEMAYIHDLSRSATVRAMGPVNVIKIDTALKQWASLPCQLRFNKRVQGVIIERLTKATKHLANLL